MKNGRMIYFGTATAILLLLVSVSGCASSSDVINQPAAVIAAGDTGGGGSSDAQNTNMQNGTRGVQNTYVALDYNFSSEILGHSGCVFSVQVLPGDTIEADITTEKPVDFISGDSRFYISFVTNIGKIDTSQDFTIYQSECLSGSSSYHLATQIDRSSFNLVVRNPDGTYDNIKGHVKIVVHSKFPKTENDTKPTVDGVIAAMNATKDAYVTEWNFTSEQFGASDCLTTVYLMPGDIVEVNVTTENPVDLISGDYVFATDFLVNGGKLKAENSHLYTVYQSESYSNATTYHLFKQVGRKWFMLAVRNPDGTYRNIKGHKRIMVASRYTRQEHNDAFINDYIKVMGYAPDFSQLPYNVVDTSDPNNTWHDDWAEWEKKREDWYIWKFGYY
jgi:hypothetical protein